MQCRRAGLIASLLAATLLVGCATSPELKNAGPDFDTAKQAYLKGDYQRALPLLKNEAKRGTPRAQYTLGYMYYNGLGVKQDESVAVEWIRQAANNGDPLAVEALSRMAVTMTRRTPGAEATELGDQDRQSQQQQQQQ